MDSNLFNAQKPITIDPTNEEMTISQVIKFFSKYEIHFTKTMIQNYIRIGLLPGPIQKRYYSENHLMLLFLIYHLKEGFSLEEIKKVFAPILKDEDTFEDDLITPQQLYDIYGQMHGHLAKVFCGSEHLEADKLIEELTIAKKQGSEHIVVQQFMVILYTMVQTIMAKKLSLVLIDNLFN